MDKFFNSMEYINERRACQWLRQLPDTNRELHIEDIMESCEHYSIPVYIDCSELKGVTALRVGDRIVMHQVIGIETCQVDSPTQAYKAINSPNSYGFSVTGLAAVLSEKEESKFSHAYSWVLTSPEGRPFLFSPDDIKRLASLLKPDKDENSSPSQPQPEEIYTSITEKRRRVIHQWFGEQQEYQADQLSKQSGGLPGPRDACWRWLEQLGLTAPGKLFHGAVQKNTAKNKVFIYAWSKFLNEMALD